MKENTDMVATCITIASIAIICIIAFVFLLVRRGGEFKMDWKGPGLSGSVQYKEKQPDNLNRKN